LGGVWKIYPLCFTIKRKEKKLILEPCPNVVWTISSERNALSLDLRFCGDNVIIKWFYIIIFERNTQCEEREKNPTRCNN